MPRSKDAHSYPPEYAKTLQKAFEEGEIRGVYPSYAVARGVQARFYSFIQAVKKKPDEFLDVILYARQVSIRIEGNPKSEGPVTLILYNKENDWVAVSLRQNFNIQKESDAAMASLEKTLGLTGQKPPADNMLQTFDYGAAPEAPAKPDEWAEVNRLAREKANIFLGKK